jgi:hypothetical protein
MTRASRITYLYIYQRPAGEKGFFHILQEFLTSLNNTQKDHVPRSLRPKANANMGNNALHVNPPVVNDTRAAIHITTAGSDLYFAICAVMGAATLAFVAVALAKPRTDRIFYYITAAITMVATISYFSMGSNLGWTPIDVEFLRNRRTVAGRNREIFYVRYIDWSVLNHSISPMRSTLPTKAQVYNHPPRDP